MDLLCKLLLGERAEGPHPSVAEERLGKLRDVQPQAHRGFIAIAFVHRRYRDHRPRCDAREQVLDLIKRSELLGEQPAEPGKTE